MNDDINVNDKIKKMKQEYIFIPIAPNTLFLASINSILWSKQLIIFITSSWLLYENGLQRLN